MTRCPWPQSDLMIAYHDTEWGVPVHDDRLHFELLTLEGAQAGLSWETVLRKRKQYRSAFVQFDPQRVARFTAASVRRLMNDSGIIRNRLKIESTISNARALLAVREEFGSFDRYIWRFVDGAPIMNVRHTGESLPASTALSEAVSKDLRARGFRFVGTTICYSYLQAAGLVNDHVIECFRRRG